MPGLKMVFKLLLFFVVCAPAWADHGHAHVGIVVGYPWGWPYPPAYPPYYPTTVVMQAPPVYVEQESASRAPQELTYWYYCNATHTYYPYVKECPAGWQKVPPQPSK